MTVETLEARILERLGEDPVAPVYYTAAEALVALNEAQRLFCLLTLCLETTATFALSANTGFYHLLPTYANFLLPLRVRVTGGAKLKPARLTDLDALDESWQAATGTPERYDVLGCDFLVVYKKPAAPGTSLDITYARGPVALVLNADTPEIPEEHHAALIDYAVPRLRAKEGGQEFAKSLPFLDRFLAAAGKMGDFVRARAIAQQYDRQPFELAKWLAQRSAHA